MTDTANPTAPPKILDGIKVVEFAQNVAIPQCGRILAGMGAEVIKVEPPGGDAMRAGNQFGSLEARAFAMINPDKRSIGLDLRSPDARPVIDALFRWADVVLVAFKQGDLARYGIDWDTARAVNPTLIHLTHTPFGPDGEYAEQGGYDVLAQSMSGMGFTMNRSEGGTPVSTRPAVNDCGTGIASALGVLAALRHRDKTGEGQRVDSSLLLTALNLAVPTVSQFAGAADHMTPSPAEARIADERDRGVPFDELRADFENTTMSGQRPFRLYFRYYRTRDGMISVAGLSRGLFAKFHAATGITEPQRDWRLGTPEFQAVIDEAEACFASKTTDEWMTTLRQAGYPCARLNLPFEALADPQVRANDFATDFEHPIIGNYTTPSMPFQMSATPVGFTNGSPRLGEHTRDVLTEIGLDPAVIDTLVDDGIVVTGPPTD